MFNQISESQLRLHSQSINQSSATYQHAAGIKHVKRPRFVPSGHWWRMVDSIHFKIKLCWAFFLNCRHARINIWPHSTVFTEQEKFCARSKSELMIKTSKSVDLNFANAGRDTEAKASPRHLNFLKQLNKTTEMCYPYISGFKIHQGTQWVPRNTITEQYITRT